MGISEMQRKPGLRFEKPHGSELKEREWKKIRGSAGPHPKGEKNVGQLTCLVKKPSRKKREETW